jgi:hypothetical protein
MAGGITASAAIALFTIVDHTVTAVIETAATIAGTYCTTFTRLSALFIGIHCAIAAGITSAAITRTRAAVFTNIRIASAIAALATKIDIAVIIMWLARWHAWANGMRWTIAFHVAKTNVCSFGFRNHSCEEKCDQRKKEHGF